MNKSFFALSAALLLAFVLMLGCAGSSPSFDFEKKSSISDSKEVTLDFLHADWCPHCQRMKPIVAKLASELPADRFLVRSWNEKNMNSDPDTQTIYNNYTALGYFQGFPTFVIGDDYRVGEIPENELKAWVCSKFKAPVPDACKN
ncbi:MAG: thioredoxin family protein [Candidatus Micrarchaeia archaeon]